jgi:ubiquitin carboxyl-terminal hydrolase 10
MANVLALLSGTTPSHPIDSDTLPRLRARGLVNSENICFANAVLQLLVHCPPFWNLFRDLGGVMGQQGLGQGQGTGGGATPLVDAKVKFLGEFVYKETLSGTQQLQQRAARGKAMDNEEGMKEDDVVSSFNPRYMFDAMKEKRQLKHLLVRSYAQYAPFYSDSC